MQVSVRTAIVVCLSAFGCGGGGDGVTGPPPVASLSVALMKSSLLIGEATTAVATVKDANGNVLTGRAMTWSSSDPTVATVSATGGVVGLSTGTASITAASEGRSGSATVTVTVAPVASVSVSFGSSTIDVGATTQATATLYDANGNVLTGRAINFSSDNTSVATVSTSGLVRGVSAGSANITATSEGRNGSATVTVISVPTASVTVSLTSSTIAVGSTTQATATARDANGNVLIGKAMTWSSDNTSVATVSTAGVVTGVSTGTANITAASEGQSGSATVTVALPVGFGSSAEKIRVVDIGITFSPTLSGPSASTMTFVSRATSVATVDAQGTITSVGEGQVWVVATAPGWVADSIYVIVPRTSTGPVLRSDLTTFNVKAGATTVVNIILDTRSTPIGGTELSVGYTTSPTVFTNVSWAPTGTPAPVVTNLQEGVLRLSLASGSSLSGELAILRLTFTTPTANTSGFLTLTLLDLVSPTGTDLLPVSTSTRIPIVVQ